MTTVITPIRRPYCGLAETNPHLELYFIALTLLIPLYVHVAVIIGPVLFYNPKGVHKGSNVYTRRFTELSHKQRRLFIIEFPKENTVINYVRSFVSCLLCRNIELNSVSCTTK